MEVEHSMATITAAEQTSLNAAKASAQAALAASAAVTAEALKLQGTIRSSLSIQAVGGSHIANELSAVLTNEAAATTALNDVVTKITAIVTGATVSG
jgi:hypothetical protein